MKIGHLITHVSRPAGHERNVPGHIQLPMKAMDLLAERGHEIHFITNECPPGRVWPAFMPRQDLTTLHCVVDSRVRPTDESAVHVRQSPGVDLRAALQQVAQIRRIVRDARLDVLHVHGYDRSIMLGGLLGWLRVGCPVVATLSRPPASIRLHQRPLWKGISAFTTATAYTAQQCARLGLRVEVIRHGTVRRLLDELEVPPLGLRVPRNRVLFWRDPSKYNGADICLAVYEALAPKYPGVSFDMALRKNPHEIAGLDELAARHANVNVHRFPYPEGVTLPGLVAESLCILLPFRFFTIHPQLAIAESLEAGAAVVTTDICSVPELIENGRTGLLVPPDDVEATIEAVESLIADPDRACAMGQAAAEDFAATWNWDRFGEETEALYENVLGARRSAASGNLSG